MPKPPNEQYKFDNDGEKIPATTQSSDAESTVSIQEVAESTEGTAQEHTLSTEKVGADSLPGFVKRNIGTFERTEGRH